jgi:hypothetical protein
VYVQSTVHKDITVKDPGLKGAHKKGKADMLSVCRKHYNEKPLKEHSNVILVLRFSCLELNGWLQISGLGHTEYQGYSNISANLADTIFRVNDVGTGFGSSFIAFTLGILD